ncbi:hypothetical protein ACWCV9_19735 [Streptomyces sp. NPDC001606]
MLHDDTGPSPGTQPICYLEKAAQWQIERDSLHELIADFAKVHGPADPEAVAAKRARLAGGASHAGAAA